MDSLYIFCKTLHLPHKKYKFKNMSTVKVAINGFGRIGRSPNL